MIMPTITIDTRANPAQLRIHLAHGDVLFLLDIRLSDSPDILYKHHTRQRLSAAHCWSKMAVGASLETVPPCVTLCTRTSKRLGEECPESFGRKFATVYVDDVEKQVQ